MRKFLIIGLGGSGGKTLGFLMDELKFSLGPEWQGRPLPKCWQFVHIDVPIQADGLGKGLASPVRNQGGTYVGLASGDSSYQTIENVVFDRLKSANPPIESHLARWLPDPKVASAVKLTDGAGAYRSIGRMVTLSQAPRIVSELRRIISELNSPESIADLTALAPDSFSAQTSQDVPLVLLVSSMAGGSGASMVLDVSDLLRGLTTPQQFDGNFSAAFLYTAEVFGGISVNSAAGSLATISELQSAMLNNSDWSSEEWDVLGVNLPKPRSQRRGPHAVFPIGAKAHGVRFGDKPEDVYRGFAKMLAPMFLSEALQVKFSNYIITNGPAAAKDNRDASRLTRRIEDGTLLSVDYAHFMGWGSATLTTGRKRYLEYVSQRLAREAARILVEGHGVDPNEVSNPMQAKRQIAENMLPAFLRGLPVGSDMQGTISAMGLIDAAFSRASSLKLVDQFRNQLATAINQHGGNGGSALAPLLGNRLRGMDEFLQEAKQQALIVLQDWARDLQTSLENEYLQIASVKGLEIANLVLDEVGRRLTTASTRDLATLLAVQSESLGSVANRALKGINDQGKSAVGLESNPAKQFLSGITQGMDIHLRREVATTLQSIVPDFVKNCLGALEENSSKLLNNLLGNLGKPPQSFATAAYREAPITDWPKDETVPSHFEPAINEVMLDSVSSFPRHFWSHLGMTVDSVDTGKEKLLAAAAQELILGAERIGDDTSRFKSLQGWKVRYSPSHEFVGRRASWVPRELALVNSQVTVSAATYSLALEPSDLIEHARRWVERPGAAFATFAAVGIREWAYPKGSESMSDAQAKQLEAEATQRLLSAISFASPLVEIDDTLLQKVHGSSASGLKYEFSEMPFSESDGIVTAIQSSWTGQATQDHNLDAVRNSLNPISDRTEVIIFSTFAAPYAAPVFKSLTQPIRERWLTSKSEKSTDGFWTMRRARPLRNFVPMQQEAIQAFVTGWLVGRISGHIQIVDNDFLEGSKRVEVYSQSSNTWLHFPADPDLLGVEGLGVSSGSAALDLAGWNIPAALLENFMLAVSNVADMDLSPLDPYWETVDMGLSLSHIGARRNNAPLQNFVNMSQQPHGKLSQLSSLSAGSLDETDVERALAYLKTIQEFALDKSSDSAASARALEDFSRSFEIAPELALAAQNVAAELEYLLTHPEASASGGSGNRPGAEPEA